MRPRGIFTKLDRKNYYAQVKHIGCEKQKIFLRYIDPNIVVLRFPKSGKLRINLL